MNGRHSTAGAAGWADFSTWGYDSGMGSFYAQLTCDTSSDDDGPDVWVTPGVWPWSSPPMRWPS